MWFLSPAKNAMKIYWAYNIGFDVCLIHAAMLCGRDRSRAHSTNLSRWVALRATPFYFECIRIYLFSCSFVQHTMRPTECVAEQCNMSNGRNHCYDEHNEYLLVLCTCCGSTGVHECCFNGKNDFICNDCDPPSKKRRKLDDSADDTIECSPQPASPSKKKRRKVAKPIDRTDMNNNGVQPNSSAETSASTSTNDFVVWNFSIKLPLDSCRCKN